MRALLPERRSPLVIQHIQHVLIPVDLVVLETAKLVKGAIVCKEHDRISQTSLEREKTKNVELLALLKKKNASVAGAEPMDLEQIWKFSMDFALILRAFSSKLLQKKSLTWTRHA